MKNIIPFKKEIVFKTHLNEITSISLENTLNINENGITGEFIVSGEYKVMKDSKTVEPFNFNIPFEITLTDRYDISKAEVDIDDFYYEIINESILSLNIDVSVDKLQEIEKVKIDDLNDYKEEIISLENRCVELDEKEEIKNKMEEEENVNIDKDNSDNNPLENRKQIPNINVDNKIKSIFSNMESEEYVTYSVCIVRDTDTIESIAERYHLNIEDIRNYNDLSNINIGDKLIIPANYEERK